MKRKNYSAFVEGYSWQRNRIGSKKQREKHLLYDIYIFSEEYFSPLFVILILSFFSSLYYKYLNSYSLSFLLLNLDVSNFIGIIFGSALVSQIVAILFLFYLPFLCLYYSKGWVENILCLIFAISLFGLDLLILFIIPEFLIVIFGSFFIFFILKKIHVAYKSFPIKLCLLLLLTLVDVFILFLPGKYIVNLFKMKNFQSEIKLVYKDSKNETKDLNGTLIIETDSFVYIQDTKNKTIAIPKKNILRMEFEKEEQKKTK
jgi:hypothetical protein